MLYFIYVWSIKYILVLFYVKHIGMNTKNISQLFQLSDDDGVGGGGGKCLLERDVVISEIFELNTAIICLHTFDHTPGRYHMPEEFHVLPRLTLCIML